MIPLYNGACIWQFNSQYWKHAGAENRNEYWLDVEGSDRHLISKERRRVIHDLHSQLPAAGKTSKTKAVLDAIGLKKDTELDQFIVPDRHFPRLPFRDIASDTYERSMVAAVIPANVGAQHTCGCPFPNAMCWTKKVRVRPQDVETLFFAPLFSIPSFLTGHPLLNSHACEQDPYLSRAHAQPTAAEIATHPDFLRLARNGNGLRLSAYYNKEVFEPLFPQLGLDASDRITTEKQADMARRENDLIIIRLYGFNKTDMEVMPGSFAVMNANRPGYAETLLEMLDATAPADSGA